MGTENGNVAKPWCTKNRRVLPAKSQFQTASKAEEKDPLKHPALAPLALLNLNQLRQATSGDNGPILGLTEAGRFTCSQPASLQLLEDLFSAS